MSTDNVLISEGAPVAFEVVYDSIREQLDDLADEENATLIAPLGATLEQVKEALAVCEREMLAELNDDGEVRA